MSPSGEDHFNVQKEKNPFYSFRLHVEKDIYSAGLTIGDDVVNEKGRGMDPTPACGDVCRQPIADRQKSLCDPSQGGKQR